MRSRGVFLNSIFFILTLAFTAGVFHPAYAEDKVAYTATDLQVPYMSQAPLGHWRDARFADGCEEASIIMAAYWAKGENVTRQMAEIEIKDLAAYEKRTFKFHQDTSAKDTAALLAYYFNVIPEVQYDITTADIRDALDQNTLVIVPVNGTKLGIYGGRVIPRHTVVVRGFDPETNIFTISDPVKGDGIKITGPVLEAALRDYPSGVHRAVTATRTAMILVHKLQVRVAAN